jgi:hypothetical protein
VKTAGKELSRQGRSGSLNGLVQSWSSGSSSVRRRSPSKFIFAPFLSVRCNPELVGLLLVHRRSPTEAHLCTVLQAFLGPQAFFCPQKVSCLCPSLQVLQSFFGIVGLLLYTEDLPLKPSLQVSQAFLGPQVFFCPQKISCLCPSLQVLRSCDCGSSIRRRSPAYIRLCRS